MANFLQIDSAGEDYCCIHNQNGTKAQDMAMMVNNLNRCFEDHIFPKYNKFDEQATQHLAALSDGLDARSVLENELLAVNRQKLRRISEIMTACRRIEGLEEDGRSAGATQSYGRSGDGGESDFCPQQSFAEDRGGSVRGGFGVQQSPVNEEQSRHGRLESEKPVANDARGPQPQALSLKSPENASDHGKCPAVPQEGEKEQDAKSRLDARSQGSAKSSDVCVDIEPKRNLETTEPSNSKKIATDPSTEAPRKDSDTLGGASPAAGSEFTMAVSDEEMIQAADIVSNEEAAQSEKNNDLLREVGDTTRHAHANRDKKAPGRDVPQPRNPAAASFITAPVGPKTRGRGKNPPGYAASRRSPH